MGMYCTFKLHMYFMSCFSFFANNNKNTHRTKTCILVYQGDEQVDLPILEVSRSNTTNVEFWISDVLRGVDVGV